MIRKAGVSVSAVLMLALASVAGAQGLKGEYWDSMASPWNPPETRDPVLTRIEAVNFNWGGNAPDPLVGPDSFTVRWSGGVTAPVTGGYRFGTRTDDGIRVRVDGELVINNWTDHSATWNRSQPVMLEEGKTYGIVVEFYENGGDAVCELYWSYPGQSEQIIPSSALSPEPVLLLQARKPSPADGAVGVAAPLFSWQPGETAEWHNVYLGTTPDLGEADLVAPRSMFTMYYHVAGLEPGTTYYWRVDEVEADTVTIHTGEIWTLTAAPQEAYAPYPRDGDKWIALDAELTWSGGQNVQSHDVYFGTDRDVVANRDASVFVGNQIGPLYMPGALQAETTYYWAVDEIDRGGVKHEGDVWTFTTTGGGGGVKAQYFVGITPGGNPVVEQTEPNIDHNWGSGTEPGTNSPAQNIPVDQFSARWTADLDIAVADTYTFATSTDDGVRVWLNGELIIENWTIHSAAVDISLPMVLDTGIYSLVMEYYENDGGAVAQLFWETPSMARTIIPAGPLQLPLRARLVYPRNKAIHVPQDATLTWAAGDEATGHHVYFGDDKDTVATATSPNAQRSLDDTTYNPGVLEWGQTYYWRIDEVNPGGPLTGSVWSFTTADFLVVDDFELYDDADYRIYEIWVDGVVNNTGSFVGYDVANNGTFGETQIVHSGGQSMPIQYDNTVAPGYSEADRTFTPGQDWTVNGVTTLVIHFRGDAANTGDLYVKINGTKVPYDGDPADIASFRWIAWEIDLASVGVNATNVTTLTIGIEGGGAGTLYVDDIWVIGPDQAE